MSGRGEVYRCWFGCGCGCVCVCVCACIWKWTCVCMWVGVGVGVNTLPFLIVHVELKALQYQSIFLEVLVDQLSLPSSSILIVRSNAMSYQLLCAKAGLSTSYMYTRSRANTSCFVCSHATIHTRVTHTRTIYTHAIYLFINTLTCKHKLFRMFTCNYPYTFHPYTYYIYTCYL